MRKTAGLVLLLLALLSFSCGNKKHDAAYYEQMVDSICRAERVKEIQKQAGIYKDPIEAWFDTLRPHTLPIQSTGIDVEYIVDLAAVPPPVNEYFGFPSNACLKAMALPSMYHRQVIMLCELQDSITPRIYLYTMSKKHQLVDMLCIYQQEEAEHDNYHGLAYNEYFITSHYEITVMRYFKEHKAKEPLLEEIRLYSISKDGMFEERAIEI